MVDQKGATSRMGQPQMNPTVNASDTFWFHCGRCGSLFQSQLGEQDDRHCDKCGQKPGLGLEVHIPPSPLIPAPAENDDIAPQPKRVSRSEIRSHKKKRNLMFKIVSGWVLLVAIIILGARRLWPEEPASQGANAFGEKNTQEVSQEDRLFLERARPAYTAAFHGFLAASTQEEQNQFVLSPASTAVKMANFYNANPLNRVEFEGIIPLQQHILQLPGLKTVETLWKTKGGQKIDAVLRLDDGEWRLDWNHYMRFSNHPWPLFLAGSGDPEGEFRLLARERLAEERKNAEEISMVLYAPRFGSPNETGFQSPEFLIKRNTPDGKLLDAAFKLARNGGQVFNSQLTNINPDGLIRVRVNVRRFYEDGNHKFQITRVIACHWYEIDDPGL